MTSNFDPGGVNRPLPSNTYANMVNARSFQKLDRNVLNIVVEKKSSDNYASLNGDQVSEICGLVGIEVGGETEGFQTHYGGQSVTLAVWMKQAISL